MPLPGDAEHSDPFAGTGYYPVTGAAPGAQTPADKRGGVSSDPTTKEVPNLETRPMGDPAASNTVEGHSDPAHRLSSLNQTNPNPRAGFTPSEVASNLQLTQQGQTSQPQLDIQLESTLSVRAIQGVGAASSVGSDPAEHEAAKIKLTPVTGSAPGTVGGNQRSNSDPTAEIGYSTNVPLAPTGLVAVLSRDASLNHIVNLSWNAPLDTVAGWQIYQQDAKGNMVPIAVPFLYASKNTTPNKLLNSTLITTTNSTAFARNNAGMYTFGVAAFNANGRISPITPVTVVIVTTPPSAPSAVALAIDAVSHIPTVSWGASVPATPDVLVASYHIAISNSLGNVVLQSSPDPVTSPWSGTALVVGNTYTAAVTARDTQGNVSVAGNSLPVTI